MKTIKHIFSRYTAFLWALLKPLGAWGVFVIAGLDGAAVGLPMDPIVATYVYQNRSGFLLYVLMASAGSMLGSIVVYAIGYKGGEELLRKRISPERFERFHQAFERHPFWSLMFPAMLPPPTPFKLFVLDAVQSFSPGHLRRTFRAIPGAFHPDVEIRSSVHTHLRKYLSRALGLGARGCSGGVGNVAASTKVKRTRDVARVWPVLECSRRRR